MAYRSVYLAKHRASGSQRAHFTIFIPNVDGDRETLAHDYGSRPCSGTVIHVVGEPLMAGYALEIKRNHECSTSEDLKELVLLGHVDISHIYGPELKTEIKETKETTPRSTLERYASTVKPPPRGQDVRAPIDGVSKRRRQNYYRSSQLINVNSRSTPGDAKNGQWSICQFLLTNSSSTRKLSRLRTSSEIPLLMASLVTRKQNESEQWISD